MAQTKNYFSKKQDYASKFLEKTRLQEKAEWKRRQKTVSNKSNGQ
jgi:hypothetical protein